MFVRSRDTTKYEEVTTWCADKGWSVYMDYSREYVQGTEHQCFVIMGGDLYAEYISRGRNMLVYVTGTTAHITSIYR